MDFVAVDVETANADLASICQIGIATFADGVLVDCWQSLVDPEDFFDEINVEIHGIDEEAVKGAPTFPQLAETLSRHLCGRLVACHTAFDRVALARVHEKYELDCPGCDWLDTARVVRRAYPQFSQRGYGLANVAATLGIDFRHHDALEDAARPAKSLSAL